MAKIQISLLVRQGRLGGYHEKEQVEFRKQILAVLETIGVPKDRQESTLTDVHSFATLDIRRRILGQSSWAGGLSADLAKRHGELYRRGLHEELSPEEIEQWLTEANLMTDEKRELLNDYRYYLQNKRHRRPEAFIADGDEE